MSGSLGRGRSRVLAVWVVCAAILAGRSSLAEGGPPSLLEGLRPSRSSGVSFAERLTDGVAARAGDPWNCQLAALFSSPGAFAVFDLGREQPVVAVWLQADHNDAYEIATSRDGIAFSSAWIAPPVSPGGLQARYASGLGASGRYLRVRAVEGDGSYSVSEIQVFSALPAPFPPRPTERPGAPMEEWLHSKILGFGLALIGFLLLLNRGAPRWRVAVLALLPILVGYDLVRALVAAWPFEQRTVSLIRGTVATVAAFAVCREVFAPRRFLAHRPAVLSVLGLCGVIAVAAFYNLGRPQFYDASQRSPTPVHILDLRQYYPVAKYFREIGYRHLYEADVAAYLEDNPNVTFEQVASLPMRSLNTHSVSTVAAQRAAIEHVKERFSPERWQAYKRDAGYLRGVMGTSQYFQYMIDYGGNASPVWITAAHVLFSAAPASNRAFLITGLLDPLLLLIAFVAIGRCFGLRTMFVSMVVFGANDYIMYGSNWAGATLRHDWLAYLGLAACCLRRGRWMLGGALLAASTMIRAFPALSLVGLTLPALWMVGEEAWKTRQLPSLRALRAAHRPVERALLGAGITLLALFTIATLFGSFGAWRDWLAKVRLLDAQAHASHISLRGLIAGWEGNQARVLMQRLPLFVTAISAYVVLVVIACRGKRLEQAALTTLILVPVVFYPANYYIHFIFLLPLLAVEVAREETTAPSPVDAAGASVWLTLLLLCAAQYWTVWIKDLALHFYMATVLLFGALTWILLSVVRRNPALVAAWQREPRPVAQPAQQAALDRTAASSGRS